MIDIFENKKSENNTSGNCSLDPYKRFIYLLEFP